MSVRIRMKRIGRRNRPFYRVCAVNIRSPRDGKVIEEIGHYDPMCREVDARAILNGERIAYWISVGATPSERVQTLIKKYGPGGTHAEQQKEALARMAAGRPKPVPQIVKLPEPVAVAVAAEGGEAPAEGAEAPAEGG